MAPVEVEGDVDEEHFPGVDLGDGKAILNYLVPVVDRKASTIGNWEEAELTDSFFNREDEHINFNGPWIGRSDALGAKTELICRKLQRICTMATNQLLSLFISSKIPELANEQSSIQAALSNYGMYGWLSENSTVARPEPIHSPYLKEVAACDIYIGLFWLGYGQYVIEEFECARKNRKPCLLYEKHVDIDKRDPNLTAFLDNIQQVKNLEGLTICRFKTSEELAERVRKDVMYLLATHFRPTFSSPTSSGKNKGIAIGTLYGHINQYNYGQSDDEQAAKRLPTWRSVQE